MVHGLILSSNNVTAIRTSLGEDVIINHLHRYQFQTLAENGVVDAVIVDSEDGFTQLGMMRRFLSADLGMPQRDLFKHASDSFPETLEGHISSLADWNRNEAEDVTLVAIPSGRQESLLKGAILAPHECSRCYKKYAIPVSGKPDREFFYNVTFEAISHAYRAWGARKIALTHLASYRRATPRYHPVVTTCQVEAIVHFCEENSGMESFTFVDEAEGNCPLEIVRWLNKGDGVGFHRTIDTRTEERGGVTFVHLDWSMAGNK